ncbi:uncharacterized protein LOC118261781 isoform X2 [Spodoptera frugiperda]|uniref:Uncharacterized protein LOC118261781 isoform X2 n=1 Tax=Spodoptera frugiperda TaxID=7108 RepID=A0A9R0EE73_SPOFR|nr:uncharacterized protein LOC118261781 isoform X2 [Spodoptera frugiperda]
MDPDEGVDDVIDLTDTSDSDSYHDRVFEAHTPLVLELHDIRKDDPLPTDTTPPPVPPPPAGKIKKQKRKKKETQHRNASYSSLSSENLSDASSVAPPPETKEKFYDARESYHGIAPNQAPTVTAAAAVPQTHSVTHSVTHSIEAAQDPKTAQPASSLQQTTTTAPTEERTEPSPISKLLQLIM